jgi:hypothetical protein
MDSYAIVKVCFLTYKACYNRSDTSYIFPSPEGAEGASVVRFSPIVKQLTSPMRPSILRLA